MPAPIRILAAAAITAALATGCGLEPGEVVDVSYRAPCPAADCHTPGWHLQTRSDATGEVSDPVHVAPQVAQACPPGSRYPDCAQ